MMIACGLISCKHTQLQNRRAIHSPSSPAPESRPASSVPPAPTEKTEKLLEAETKALCHEAKTIKNDSKLVATNADFEKLTSQLASLDCDYLHEFVKSEEFEQVFSQQEGPRPGKETLPERSARQETDMQNQTREDGQKASQETDQQDQDQKDKPGLANPEEVPKMLLVMSLLGFATATRMHILQGRHKTAVFQWVVSGITMYLSVKSAKKDIDRNEQMVVPWVFLLNGMMASIGAYGILSDGINKARYWNTNASAEEIKEFIKRNPGFEGEDFSKLNYEKFQIWYNQQVSSKKKSVLDQFKLDDSRLVELTEGKKINMDPRHLKILLGGAVTGFGVVSAAFAIRQLMLGTQELRNNFKLAQTSDPKTYGDVLASRISRIRSLKNELTQTLSGQMAVPSLQY